MKPEVLAVFFDKLAGTEQMSLAQQFEFVKDIGNTFAPVYTKFMDENKAIYYGKNEKQFQLMRRGRYVEFNLVYDKGTKFGLDTDGRTESILMSMPPEANWIYNYTAPENSPEAYTLSMLKKESTGLKWKQPSINYNLRISGWLNPHYFHDLPGQQCKFYNKKYLSGHHH